MDRMRAATTTQNQVRSSARQGMRAHADRETSQLAPTIGTVIEIAARSHWNHIAGHLRLRRICDSGYSLRMVRPGRTIAIGSTAQGLPWEAKLLVDDKALLKRIGKISDRAK
jgi:hypothetical protein